MSAPVSVVVPALDERPLLEWSLGALLAALKSRAGADDEVLVVDDTGEGALAAWLVASFPTVRVHAPERNGGFARALTDGIGRARHPLVFAMNSDLRVRPGFLEPLVAALEDPQVFAAAPRVLRLDAMDGVADEARVESAVQVDLRDGLARVRQPCLEDPPLPPPAGPRPIPFALGGACLLRRDELAALGGLDPLFAPFYLEDVDLCWRAWRAGRRIALCPDTTVEHLNQATIGARAGRDLALAAIERNLLLFQWKHLDGEAALRAHVAALERRAREALLQERRDDLVPLALALERLDAALAARAARPPPVASFAELAATSSPFPA